MSNPPLVLPDRYEIKGDPMSGGMGSVIVCRDNFLERQVAIKVLQEVTEYRRLSDELTALQSIRSKHVVEIFDVITDTSGRAVGIVQDYIPGLDLFAVAKTGLSSNAYLKTIFQIASGISDIHSHGLIHRDIKPSNMKLDGEGIVKLYDFGLSRFSGVDSATKGFVGTVGFAAPELYQTGTAEFSEAVDTYAFGATAWYLAERTLPAALMAVPPEPFSTASSFSQLTIGIPTTLTDILDSTLSESPEDRPTMQEVTDAIGRHLLYGRHRAILINGPAVYEFTKIGQVVTIGNTKVGSLKIRYNGFGYVAESVLDEVYVNASLIYDGFLFPGSCVISIGAPYRGFDRAFVTLDISQPEVVL